MVNSPKDIDLYLPHSIVIAKLSRAQNIKVLSESNYIKKDNCIFDTAGSNRAIYLLFEVIEGLQTSNNTI